MVSDVSNMLDLGAIVIVLMGTFLATLARCGWGDMKIAISALTRIGAKGFDLGENRMAIAPSISEINRRGPLCSDIPLPPDPSLARVVIAYARSGSIEALDNARRCERAKRETTTARAVQTFEYAGELAPVFGLVGTLFAITQLAPLAGDEPVDTTMASIATAVQSSLYGVLIAHLVCIPIARAIERKASRDEDARDDLIVWLKDSLAGRTRSDRSPRRETIRKEAA